jgi:hypothetical protein
MSEEPNTQKHSPPHAAAAEQPSSKWRPFTRRRGPVKEMMRCWEDGRRLNAQIVGNGVLELELAVDKERKKKTNNNNGLDCTL